MKQIMGKKSIPVVQKPTPNVEQQPYCNIYRQKKTEQNMERFSKSLVFHEQCYI